MRKLDKNGLLIQLRDFGIGPIVGMCISLITVPITTRLLDPAEFAKTSMFSLCQTIFFLVCLLGCDQSYVRFYNEDKVSKKSLLVNCFIFPFICCAFSMALIGIFNQKISFFLFDQYEPVLILFIILTIPVCVINRFCEIKVRMDMRGKTYSFLTLFQQVLSFVLLVLFLLFYEVSYRSIIFSSCFSSIIYCVVSIGLSRIFAGNEAILFDWKLIKELLKFGIPLVFASILTYVMNSFDKVAIRLWSSLEELGLYTAGFKIVAIVNLVQNIFTTAWTPVALKWYEQNEPKERFHKVSDIAISGMLLLFGLIIIFRKVLLLYLGEKYRNTSEIFVFLLFSPVCYTISSITSLGIDFKKKSFYTTIVSAIVAVINILGNYLLVPKYGAIGASITTAFSFVCFLWLRTLISNRLWCPYSLWKIFVLTLLLVLYGINMLTYKSVIIELILFCLSLLFGFLINRPFLKEFIRKKGGN